MTFKTIWTLTLLTFHEARRRKMVMAALALGLLFVVVFDAGAAFLLSKGASQAVNLGTAITSVVQTEAFTFLLTMGMYVVHFLVIMLTIFASVDAISGEISTHTIQTIVTKPLRRWEVVVGKWLGYSLMIVPYIALLTGGIYFSIWAMSGTMPPNILPAFLLLTLEVFVLLSLSLLGGTRFSTLTNGVVLFMLYGVAFVGSWIEQFGSLLQSHEAINVGIVASLLMPVESLWSLASYSLQSDIIRDLPSGLRMSPILGTASLPSTNMVVYAAAYAFVVLALAVRAFSRRDL